MGRLVQLGGPVDCSSKFAPNVVLSTVVLLFHHFLFDFHAMGPIAFSVEEQDLKHFRLVGTHRGNIFFLEFLFITKFHLFLNAFYPVAAIVAVTAIVLMFKSILYLRGLDTLANLLKIYFK